MSNNDWIRENQMQGKYYLALWFFPCEHLYHFIVDPSENLNLCLAHAFLCTVQIDRSGKIPMLRFRDRESYAKNKTKEYDDLAMKYLSYVLFFLVACFAVYSLMYERHKSWYSWILSSLTSCVYMFGKHCCALFRILNLCISTSSPPLLSLG